MKFIDFYKRTKRKNELMKEMISVMDVVYYDPVNGFNKNVPSKEEKDRVLNDFFDYISNDEILGKTLKEFNITFDLFNNYINLMQQKRWGME